MATTVAPLPTADVSPGVAETEIRPDIVAAFGNTPLVRLNAVTRGIRTVVVRTTAGLSPRGRRGG